MQKKAQYGIIFIKTVIAKKKQKKFYKYNIIQ